MRPFARTRQFLKRDQRFCVAEREPRDLVDWFATAEDETAWRLCQRITRVPCAI